MIRCARSSTGSQQTSTAFPREGSWRDFLSATLTLLGRWIERGQLTEERLERVIAPMDRFAPPPTRQQFLARVRDLIATQVYREGSLAEGRVFVGPTSVAGGLQFRVVFVPGMVERRFPSVARPDPLLLDEERESLSPALRTSVDEQEQERIEFVEACASGEERLVLSYPRVDGQSGRERVPSSFLLRAARAATGHACRPRISRGSPRRARPRSAGRTRRIPTPRSICSSATSRWSRRARKGRRGTFWTKRRTSRAHSRRSGPRGLPS